MRRAFPSVTAAADEVAAGRPGDDIVAAPDVVMDRAFTVDASPELVWPWMVQLGKARADWYFPRSVERFVPTSRRAIRRIDPQWQNLSVGDVIPDYVGRDASFTVAILEAPGTLVHTSQRGRVSVSWSINLLPARTSTRLHLRLVLGPVKHQLVARAGELFDAATIAGMAAGLRERISEPY